jgi:PAS domain S-box-containing protein
VNTHSSAVVVVVAAGRSLGTTLYMDKITYCLDADPRPTCVLDLDSASSSSSSPHIHFENKALREEQNNHLLHDIRDSGASTAFRTWALDSEQSGTVTATPRASIHAYTIDKRWRVIQWLLHERRKLTLAPDGHNSPGQHHQTSAVSPKSDSSSTLNRKLEDALADRDDATGRLSNLRQMMGMVEVGMFEYDKEGVLLYGNDAFHRLTGMPKGNREPMEWANWIFEEDRPWLFGEFARLADGESSTFEMRWVGSDLANAPGGQWVTAACLSTTDDEGGVVAVSGCITDISAQKRSHQDAVKRAEALERAQASELRFSDFVKHSNSAFYNFGVDRKVSEQAHWHGFRRRTAWMLTLHRCDIATPSGSKSAATPSCPLKKSTGTSSSTPQTLRS